MKPTAKHVDECLDIVQLQNAKAVMTPLKEQKSLNLHDETTACDPSSTLIVHGSCRKTAVNYWSETRSDVCDKMLVIHTCVTNICRFETYQESVEFFLKKEHVN